MSTWQGPLVYLLERKEICYKAMKNFEIVFDCPTGLHIQMTLNVFMTDEACVRMKNWLCTIICEMPVIEDNSEKWVLLSLDGFDSHLNMDTLQVFASYKILFVKDEGELS